MTKPFLSAAMLLTATTASAEIEGIQNHMIQKMFMEAPCISPITAISPSGPPDLGMMAMAFGFLMGFEASHPGIRGDHETILKRLMAECSIDSNKTAFEMLQGYAAE